MYIDIMNHIKLKKFLEDNNIYIYDSEARILSVRLKSLQELIVIINKYINNYKDIKEHSNFTEYCCNDILDNKNIYISNHQFYKICKHTNPINIYNWIKITSQHRLVFLIYYLLKSKWMKAIYLVNKQ
jgi:hypothetical protein